MGGRMIDNLVEAMSTENRFNWSAYSSDMHKILLHDYQNLRNVSSEKYRMKMQFFMKLDLTSNRKPKTLFPFPLLALTTLWVNLGKRKLLLYLFVDDTNTDRKTQLFHKLISTNKGRPDTKTKIRIKIPNEPFD